MNRISALIALAIASQAVSLEAAAPGQVFHDHNAKEYILAKRLKQDCAEDDAECVPGLNQILKEELDHYVDMDS